MGNEQQNKKIKTNTYNPMNNNNMTNQQYLQNYNQMVQMSNNNNNVYQNPSQSNPNLNTNIYQQQQQFNNNNNNSPQKINNSSMFQRTNTYSRKHKYTVSIKNLKDAFRNFCIDGDYLNKDRFNDAIESIFSAFKIPNMHYTYLSERIYDILDDSQDGKIQEDEFLNGFSSVLKDKDFRMKVSMLAMMKRIDYNRNYLDVMEIKEFFFQSFIYAYRHLGWKIKKMNKDFISKNIPVPTIKQLELYAEKYENKIKNAVEKDLMEIGINPGGNIDQETFKKWIYKDHTINIKYAYLEVNIATTLTKLDEIGFDETNLMNTSSLLNQNLNLNDKNNKEQNNFQNNNFQNNSFQNNNFQNNNIQNNNIQNNNNQNINVPPVDPYSDLNDF
jgi:hypothetical protein